MSVDPVDPADSAARPAAAAAGSTSLRERKKARTRAAIQRHALRLFQEQGYDQTTVEQIAEAAEVSQSTLFRYFPTKEDTVLADEYDPVIVAAFHAQPAELSPTTALRQAIRDVFASISDTDRELIRQRQLLALRVPQLRAASLLHVEQTIQVIAQAVAERTGREADDLAVRTYAGAMMGAWIAAMFHWAAQPGSEDIFRTMDEAMAHLEDGLPL
ncbi:acyl-CoA-like ligand-binding transcription factor [Rugosimonospora africana]|uniref:TetR family transcriptional regulator n=1 Tax=Rugosimonospora africana TaxID=556532 RepID=A0A8J3VPZ7_9ACTN|nr:TetR family transcriptional regulator [Rugosimonospora africana]GIH14619.1 TetR family transcriptional regulator [Rugosimonospora africana]